MNFFVSKCCFQQQIEQIMLRIPPSPDSSPYLLEFGTLKAAARTQAPQKTLRHVSVPRVQIRFFDVRFTGKVFFPKIEPKGTSLVYLTPLSNVIFVVEVICVELSAGEFFGLLNKQLFELWF